MFVLTGSQYASARALSEDDGSLPDPVPLNRGISNEFRNANARAANPLERQISNNMAARFENMKTWADTDHPIVLWLSSPQAQEVEGMQILSLNKQFVSRYIDQGMKQALIQNNLDFDRDWSNLKSEEGISIIQKVQGYSFSPVHPELKAAPIDHSYVITVDNLLKMISIQMRLKNNLPVVIMGETGCGKSSLITQLCAIIQVPLKTLNIHGGMEDQDVVEWMEQRVMDAISLGSFGRLVVFLDEVNTCNCMGLFKEIICDHSLNGDPLPENMAVIAACNPYRTKKGIGKEEATMAGLVFDHFKMSHGENVGTGIKDPLANLVYRVHPLPESMIDYVFDFGSLSPDTERIYIKAMLKRQLAIYVTQDEQQGKEQISKSGQSSEDDEIEAILKQGEGCSDEQLQELLRKYQQKRGSKAPADELPRQNPQQVEISAPAPRKRGVLSKWWRKATGSKSSQQEKLQEEIERMENLHSERQSKPAEPRGPHDIDPSVLAEIQEKMMKARWGAVSDLGEFVEVFADLICAAQEFVRVLHEGERSVVSLRDVARCLKVYKWFGEHFSAGKTKQWKSDFFSASPKAQSRVRQAVILSLAYCYHARLPRDQRLRFRRHIANAWQKLQAPVASRHSASSWWLPRERYGHRSTWLHLTTENFAEVVTSVQISFVKHMNLGEGIALNEALLENLFMILVSVLNNIPIFVIGKPGSSKSLAMGLIQTNLNGDASENPFLRSLPAVEVFSYQCSPLSTSQGIEQAFEAAERYKREAPGTRVVVLLDEVGLAEQSPHLPLKVLHKVLDEGVDKAVVGISNWSLDPAKMNRAVHLFRPAPDVRDLSNTAEGMVRSANLKGYLQSLARAYSEVYHNQTQQDFWGLREFYSTVRHINRALQKRAASSENDLVVVDGPLVLSAVQRNYGGKPKEMENVIQTFFNHLGVELQGLRRLNVDTLVRANFSSPEARHLMLLTKNNAALGLLFDLGIIDHSKTEVIFGSDFPSDQTDLQVCLNIQRVKQCMAVGVTVVLVHCEALYESLYDLLNQHYTEYGGQQYVRLAFGTNSRLCPVKKEFRIVVVVEKIEAYTRLAPPLLNRFEKQVMERHNLLQPQHEELVRRLHAFASLVAGVSQAKATNLNPQFESNIIVDMKALRETFCGFHPHLLPSLAQSILGVRVEASDNADVSNAEELFQEAARRLLWIATPEAVCRVAQENKDLLFSNYNVDITQVYFQAQLHSDLASFLKFGVKEWKDELGLQSMVLTFSPFSHGVREVLSRQFPSNGKEKNLHVTALHELSSERDLKQKIETYFSECDAQIDMQGVEAEEKVPDNSVNDMLFVLQCDPLATSLRRIDHARYILENSRAKYIKKIAEMKKKGAQKIPNVHIVLLVHLPRNEVSYCFDFDLRWRFAMVDGIEAASRSGLPDIQAMLRSSSSMGEVIRNLDLKLVLSRCFRTALSRLVYLHERTNDDVRRQILFISEALCDDDFVSASRRVIASMVKRSGLSLDLLSAANQGQQLAIAGTFQAALHRQITETVSSFFALLLSHIDRNSCFQLLGPNARLSSHSSAENGQMIRKVWLKLFERSATDMNLGFNRFVNLGEQAGRSLNKVEVPSDGKGAAFDSQFPFSFYLVPLLESFRQTTETSSSPETALQQQFELLNIDGHLSKKKLSPETESKQPEGEQSSGQNEQDPEEKQDESDIQHNASSSVSAKDPSVCATLPEVMLRRYVFDLCCLLSDHCDNVSSNARAEITWRLLTSYGRGTPPESLSSIHSRWWRCEGTLRSYFLLINAIPEIRESVVHLLGDRTLVVGPQTDFAVIEIVCSALLPTMDRIPAVEVYSSWMATIQRVRATVASLLSKGSEQTRLAVESGAEDEEHIRAAARRVISKWEKVLFFYTFVRDVGLPLRIEPVVTLKTLLPMQDMELRSHLTFQRLLRVLSDLNRSFSREEQDAECDICLRIPEDPVRMCGREACRRLVCRVCAEDYLKTPQGKDQCFWCRGKNPDLITTFQEQDNELVHKSKHKEGALQAAASRFMDFYLFEFCFNPLRFDQSEASDLLEPALLRDLIRLLVDRDTVRLPEGDDPDRYFINVVPSDAARVALLRSLLALKDVESKNVVESELFRTLKEDASSCMLDTTLCVTYSSVQQGFIESRIKTVLDAVKACQDLDLSHFGAFPAQDKDIPVHHILQTIALTRRVVCIFAEALLRYQSLKETAATLRGIEQKKDDLKKASMLKSVVLEQEQLSGQILLLKDALEPVFSQKCLAHRSIRFFLLKNLERQRGSSFVRLALSKSEMLKGSKWLAEWLSSGEVGLLRFLGESKLPTNNPFVSLPMFADVHKAISSALVQGGSCDSLETLAKSIKTPVEKARFTGALLAALFHEVYILAVLDEVPGSFQKQTQQVRTWLQSSPSLQGCTDKELNLLLFFSQFNNASGQSAATQLLHLSPSSSPNHISIVRVMVHFVAVCISEAASTSHGTLLGWFYSATFRPEVLKDSFWPAMPEDVQAMAIRVLGGRWYRCPNGHSYYVVPFNLFPFIPFYPLLLFIPQFQVCI